MRVHFWEGSNEEISALDLPGLDWSVGSEIPKETEILVKGFLGEGELLGLDRLKSVVIPWAGLPVSSQRELLKHPEVLAFNIHHNSASTAEMALALLMSCARRVVNHDALMRSGDWAPRWSGVQSVQLRGKKMVVLGYGEIGRRIAKMGLGLDMEVYAVRRSGGVGMQDGVWVHGVNELTSVLPGCAALMCALPMTEETKRLIGRDELALLDKNSVVVNVGRGPIFDEQALFESCRDRRIFGAGLDVWWKYPKEGENSEPGLMAWHELDNVVMSPHVGGGHFEIEDERMSALTTLLRELAQGRIPKTNLVDVSAGY